MDDTTTAQDFAAIVAIARRHSGMSAAEMDFSLATPPNTHGLGQEGLAAIGDAIGHLVVERAGGFDALSVRELRERCDELRARIAPRLDAMIAAAKAKAYTGCTVERRRGPVRYADA